MTYERLGVGIIGCGNISSAYLRLAARFATFRIRAVADMRPEAAVRQSEAFGIDALSVEDLLARDDIQIVVNLTVPTAHADVTRQILAAGKHAYSEKPFVLSVPEGEAIAMQASASGLRVASAPDTFLGGAHQQARALVDSGRIGAIHSGTAHVMSRGMEHWHPNPDFFFQPGAGPVLDLGPYYITNLIQLLGPVKRVAAMATRAFSERTILSEPRHGETIPVQTPTTVHALLEFTGGARVTLGASWDVLSHGHAPMELYGTSGSLFLPDPNHFGGVVEIAGPDALRAPEPGWDHPAGRPSEPNGVANYRGLGLADLSAAIQDGRPARCDQGVALHAVDVLTGLLRAAEDGTVLSLATSCSRPAALSPTEAAAVMVL